MPTSQFRTVCLGLKNCDVFPTLANPAKNWQQQLRSDFIITIITIIVLYDHLRKDFLSHTSSMDYSYLFTETLFMEASEDLCKLLVGTSNLHKLVVA